MNSDSVEGKILWSPTEKLEVRGSLQHSDLHNTNLLRSLVPAPSSTPVGSDYDVKVGKGSVVFSANYFRTPKDNIAVGQGNFVDENGQLGASLTCYGAASRYQVRAFGQNLTDQRSIGRSRDALKVVRAQVVPLTYGASIGFNF